ncbi:hypothetical protein D3C85_1351410 [compost metagenome]
MRRECQLCRGFQLFAGGFERVIVSTLQFRDAFGIDIEADHPTLLAKLHSEGKAHVAKADDRDRLS